MDETGGKPSLSYLFFQRRIDIRLLDRINDFFHLLRRKRIFFGLDYEDRGAILAQEGPLYANLPLVRFDADSFANFKAGFLVSNRPFHVRFLDVP